MATNFTYYTWKQIPASLEPFHIIKTHVSNIIPETILKPVHQSGFTGINAGFFASDDYNQPPTEGRSISYNPSDENVKITFQGRTLAKNYLYNGTASKPVSSKTFVAYKDASGATKAAYMYVSKAQQVFDKYGKSNVKAIIGGTDFNEESWGAERFWDLKLPNYYGYRLPVKRSMISFKDDQVYLIVGVGSISYMRDIMDDLGLSATNTIILDGSGSSQMQYKSGGTFVRPQQDTRYVFNMVRLKNDN